MKYKFQYHHLEERENILNSHSDLVLIEEQNILEGNFLIFTDPNPNLSIEQRLSEAENMINLILLGGI